MKGELILTKKQLNSGYASLTTNCFALKVGLTGQSAQPSFSRCICNSSSLARWYELK